MRRLFYVADDLETTRAVSDAVHEEGIRDHDFHVVSRDEAGLSTPVFVGSGVTSDTVGELLAVADGVIVGTALKEGGETTNPVSVGRVEELVAAADRVR